MRMLAILFLTVCFLLFSCRTKDKPADDIGTPEVERALLENPSSWIKLTEKDGKQVIYQPCDANNTEIRIAKDTLYINWGQEEEFFSIVSFEEAGDKTLVKVKADQDA